MTERLTEEVLQELLDSPSLDEFIDAHEFPRSRLRSFLGRCLRRRASSVRA